MEIIWCLEQKQICKNLLTARLLHHYAQKLSIKRVNFYNTTAVICRSLKLHSNSYFLLHLTKSDHSDKIRDLSYYSSKYIDSKRNSKNNKRQ